MKKLLFLVSLALAALLPASASAAVVGGSQNPTSINWNDPSKFFLTYPAASLQSNFLFRGDGSWVSGSDLASIVSGLTLTGGLSFSTGVQQHYFYNFSTSGQAPAATTRTYITGSDISGGTNGVIVAGTIAVGTHFHWEFDLTKTAAGSATSTIDIAFGTAGTTADTAQLSFTKPAGTAAADQGYLVIDAVVKTVGASGVVIGNMYVVHNLAATGHMVIPTMSQIVTSGAFNTATVTHVGLCITSGASDAITINQSWAKADNL